MLVQGVLCGVSGGQWKGVHVSSSRQQQWQQLQISLQCCAGFSSDIYNLLQWFDCCLKMKAHLEQL